MATNKKRTALDDLLPPSAAVSPVGIGGTGRVKALLVGEPQGNAAEKIVTGGPATKTALVSKPEIVKLMLYLPLPVADQLRGLHFEEQRGQAKKRKMHDYCLEAIDLLFSDRGLKSIGELMGKE